MHLSILHSSTYTYQHPVRGSQNDLRLIPVSDAFQVCHDYTLELNPQPPSVLRSRDFFTNLVEHFNVDPVHASLAIIARSTVETFADERDFGLEKGRAELASSELTDLYYDFLQKSQRVDWSPALWRQAIDLTDGEPLASQAVAAINRHIFEHFHYAPGETGVDTPMAQVLETRRGVCQDFAHIMLAFCRAVAIPARYVSGYFLFRQGVSHPQNEDRALSAGASHAWVECYLAGIGWVGYDPTHGCRIDQRYVKVAVGRDYSDVRPISGTYRGKATADLDVRVEVESCEPTALGC